MTYIIENANLLKNDRLEQNSLLIKEDRIDSIRPSFERFSYMRVNASSFVMTPPHVLFCPQFPSRQSFQVMKKFYIDKLITRGSTMFLTYVEIDKEYLLRPVYNNMKTALLNSPIDYTIGVKIPLRLLTTSFLIKCKRAKIPAIFVEVEDEWELKEVPWGWLREAMFPYNSPLIPVFVAETEKQRRQAEVYWQELLYIEKIPFIGHELKENVPISREDLCKLGIYPVKSGLHHGGEVSYNLYLKDDLENEICEKELFMQLNERLLVTVHKGMVIRAGKDVQFRPGFGEYVVIKTPAFFKVN